MTTIFNRFTVLLIAFSACSMIPVAHAVTVAMPPPTPVTPSALLTYKFDFNNIVLPTVTPLTTGYMLGAIGKTDNISLALTASLGAIAPGAKVTAAGAIATQHYNGEGRVAQTLGNSDGSGGINLKADKSVVFDTFLVNNNFGYAQPALADGQADILRDRFTLAFQGFTVTSVQFDYEIFPDAQCRMGSGCGPDMSFQADGIQKWMMTTMASTTTDPQKLGSTGTITFSGAQLLTFVDWPSEVGIDNLVITGCVTAVNGQCGPSKVPEPTTLALFGLGLVGLAARRRQKRASR